MNARITALIACLGCTSFCPAAFADWPVAYQNPNLTRALYADGDITVPAIRSKKRLGGVQPPVLVQDVSGDGKVDVVMLVGGRAVCRDPESGAIIWASQSLELGFFHLDDKDRSRDLNGDGRVDILVNKRPVGDTRVYALDGRTGKIQWTFGEGLGANSGVNGRNWGWLGNTDSDPTPEFLLWVPHNEQGAVVYGFDFEDGFGADVEAWKSEPLDYWGLHVFTVFDATGNGALNVLMSSAKKLRVMDARTGATVSETDNWYGDFPAIPYGTRVSPVEADGDNALELYTAFGFGGLSAFHGVWALSESGGLTQKWRKEPGGVLLGSMLVDIDGSGVDEVVLSVFNEDGDDRWTTSVLDASDGSEVATLKDWVITGGSGDLTGDGKAEVVVVFAPSQQLASPTTVQLVRLGELSLEPIWEGGIADAEYAAVIDRDSDGVSELLIYRDGVGQDNVLDAMELFADGDQGPIGIAKRPFKKNLAETFVGVHNNLVGASVGQMLVFSADGFLDVLEPVLDQVAGERLPAGGYAPPILATRLLAGGEMTAFVNESSGRTVAVKLATGGPQEPHLSTTLFTAESERRILALIDVDGDGGKEMLVESRAGGELAWSLVAVDGTTIRWTWAPESVSFGLETVTPGLGGDLDGDGVLDFYFQTVIDNLRTGVPVSGKTGQPLGWDYRPYQPSGGVGTSYSPALMHDFDGDGLDDVFLARYEDRLDGVASTTSSQPAPLRILKGTDGSLVADSGLTVGPGRTTLVNLDSDTSTKEVVVTWWNGRGAVQTTPGPAQSLDTVWNVPVPGPNTRGMPMAADLTGNGLDDVLHFDHNSGVVRAIDGSSGEVIWEEDAVYLPGERQLAEGRCWKIRADGTGWADASTGEQVTKLKGTSVAEAAVLVSNLTGQLHPSAVFAGGDGWLYAINAADGTLDWALDFGFEVGAVVAADADDDGLVELVATVADGHLYTIDSAADVGIISEVRDGLIGDADAVDSASVGIGVNSFSANWDAASGGNEPVQGYLVRLLTDTGALVVDWQDAGTATEVTYLGLAKLTAGVTYQVVVMPYGLSGAGQSFRSDGFWFKDSDNDGLLEGDEAKLQTDPFNADTDGDGLDDGVEAPGGEAIDTDMDGVIDALDDDSDGDGVPDELEGAVDTDEDGTPDYQDTDDDNDGIATAVEYADSLAYESDPDTDGLDAWRDTDADGDGKGDYEDGVGDVDGDGIPNYLDSQDDMAGPPPIGPGNDRQTVFVLPQAEASDCSAGSRPGSGGLLVVVILTMITALRIRRRMATTRP